MFYDALLATANAHKIKVKEIYLAGKKSWLVGNIIAIDPEIRKTPYLYNWLFAHELGHFFTCPFDLTRAPKSTRNKYEHIADRHAAEHCLPIHRIISLIESGASSVADFVDATELDYESIVNIFSLYQDIYGYNYRCGSYIIQSFVPFQYAGYERS